jgi:hypothetical protein
MSLTTIISQLQTIQPRGKNATGESLSYDIMRARDSLLKLARLLQGSGRMRGSSYQPNQSRASENDQKIGKAVQQNTGDLNQLGREQKGFKQYTERTVKELSRQLRAVAQNNNRNQSVIKAVQNEIGLGRPQRITTAMMSGTATQVPSFGRNIRAQLNRINQQIRLLDANQQRIADQNERILKTSDGGNQTNIIGPREQPKLAFARRADYMRKLDATALRALPVAPTKTMLFSTFLMYASMSGGAAFTDSLKSLGEKIKDLEKLDPEKLNELVEKIKNLGAGTPYMVDGKAKIKGSKEALSEDTAMSKKRDELQKLIDKETDEKKKEKLKTELADIKKSRLELLQKNGIVLQEHVDAGMATADKITYASTEDGKYVDINAVKEFPTLWTDADKDGLVELLPNWEEEIKKEEIAKKVETFKAPKAESENGQAGAGVGIKRKDLNRALEGSDNAEFMQKVTEVAEKYQLKVDDLLALMYKESGLNPKAQNKTHPFKETEAIINGKKVKVPAGYATGLIQFIPETAMTLGTTTDALMNMSRVEQMEYVDKFLALVNAKGSNAGELRAKTFLPSRADQDVLARKGEIYYDKNAALDVNEDGVITKEDLAKTLSIEEETPSPIASTTAPKVEVPGTSQEDVDRMVANVNEENMNDLERRSDEAYAHGLAAMNTLKALGQKVAQHDVEIAKVNNKASAAERKGISDFKVKDPNFFA